MEMQMRGVFSLDIQRLRRPMEVDHNGTAEARSVQVQLLLRPTCSGMCSSSD